MIPLHTATIQTEFGQKEIQVYYGDIMEFDGDIDILTTSAFVNSYAPTPRTVFKALHDHGISVAALAADPEIDLRPPCRTWLSREVGPSASRIRRIGCVEFNSYADRLSGTDTLRQSSLNSIRAYFAMLDLAAVYNIKMDTVVLPLLGSGSQHIAPKLMIVPLVSECVAFLKRNRQVKRICFIEKNPEIACIITGYMLTAYSVLSQSPAPAAKVPAKEDRPLAFISHSSKDRNIAHNLCAKLEQSGIAVWYAPRDVQGSYADSIVRAIEKASIFVFISSRNSLNSQHVLNEIDLAFKRYPEHMKLKVLRIDESMFEGAFEYYLSRQHWMDAIIPPLEDRLNDFVRDILSET